VKMDFCSHLRQKWIGLAYVKPTSLNTFHQRKIEMVRFCRLYTASTNRPGCIRSFLESYLFRTILKHAPMPSFYPLICIFYRVVGRPARWVPSGARMRTTDVINYSVSTRERVVRRRNGLVETLLSLITSQGCD